MAERECSRCGEGIEYSGKGRPPTYCRPCASVLLGANLEVYRQAKLEQQRQWSLSTTWQCAVCGGDFHPATKKTVCCSKKCKRIRKKQQCEESEQRRREEYLRDHGVSRGAGYWQNKKERGPFVCLNCGKSYMTKRSPGQGEKYCSRECSQADAKTIRAKQVWGKHSRLPDYTRLKPCDECGEGLVKYSDSRRVCQSCKEAKEKESRKAVCRHCGAGFEREKKGRSIRYYCSDECSKQAKKETRKRNAAAARKKRGSGRSRARARYHGAPYEYINVMKVFARDGWKCQICGVSTPKSRRGTKHFNAPELDHIIPISKGGGHLYSNVQCACKRCNAEKSDSLTHSQQTSLFTVLRPAEMGTGG